jgi:hypothetical protein
MNETNTLPVPPPDVIRSTRGGQKARVFREYWRFERIIVS